MRARMAIWCVGIRCELREVVLRDKPQALIEASAKATVPVLVTPSGRVIDESLDIMLWALEQGDPEGWLSPRCGSLEEMLALIARNDDEFKLHLDRYKYPNRYEDVDPLYHRAEAERFLGDLNAQLSSRGELYGPSFTLADVAIGPFIRQFANTNRAWFDTTPYPALKAWLERFLSAPVFTSVMAKYPQWCEGDPPTFVP